MHPLSTLTPSCPSLIPHTPPHFRLQHCESRGIKDPEALDLLEQLLTLNPKARIAAIKAVTVRLDGVLPG